MGRSAAVALAVLRAMGTTIIEIENAPLWLNSLVVSHAFTSPEELLQKLVVHYRGQVCTCLSKVLLVVVHIREHILRWRFVALWSNYLAPEGQGFMVAVKRAVFLVIFDCFF